jgi:hypothetical protein
LSDHSETVDAVPGRFPADPAIFFAQIFAVEKIETGYQAYLPSATRRQVMVDQCTPCPAGQRHGWDKGQLHGGNSSIDFAPFLKIGVRLVGHRAKFT